MRKSRLALVAAALAGCSTVPAEAPPRSAEAEAQYQRLIAGKVAVPSRSCVSDWSRANMSVIDGTTLAFSEMRSRVSIVTLGPGCSLLARPQYALLTDNFRSGLCTGDIAKVIDPLNPRMPMGSCVVTNIATYSAP